VRNSIDEFITIISNTLSIVIDTGIRPPLCELEEKHYQRIIDALNLANVQLK
jgi:hypothetical protein